MKALIAVLSFVFCLNAAATFDSAENVWKVCAPEVRAEAQSQLDDIIRNATNPTLTGELGSTYDIHADGDNTVQSTTFYTLKWKVGAEGMPTSYGGGEFVIRAESSRSTCRIVK